MSRRVGVVVAGILAGAASVAAAQSDEGRNGVSSYRDPTAAALHAAAMTERERVDHSLLSYTAVVRQRIGASIRMPLKDRTIYRSEAAHRLFWRRDGDDLVQVLAFREQTPGGVNAEDLDLGRFEGAFDPMDDRLLFGFASRDEDTGDADSDDFWFEHPLYAEWVESYWFSSGDTLTVSLPDGRRVVAIELQVVPREADVHRMVGSLWIEPSTGSLVRAVYRLSDIFDAFRDIPDLQEEEEEDLSMIPGIFKPWTVEISMIAVDYALWDFEVWLPRSMRMDGIVAAGIIKAPITVDYSYEMESVTTEKSLAQESDADRLPEVHFRTRSEAMAHLNHLAFGEDVPYAVEYGFRQDDGTSTRFLFPEDRAFLSESPDLPPPIWEEAPGFTSEAELRTMFDGLASLPGFPVPQMPATLRWGLQRPDLLRFNRVEGVSVGVRGQIRPQTFVGPLSVTATLRLGAADLDPNARLDVARETLRRRVTLSAFNELAAIDEGARHLGLGNSALAFFFGRDDGDYYRRSGASLEWTPPSAGRRAFSVRGYAEYHRAADVGTNFALLWFWKDYRPNVLADEGWEYGGVIGLAPWWGTDPKLAQGGLDLVVQGGVGETQYVRSSLIGRAVFPLSGDIRFAVEGGGGTSWGAPSVQRLWYVGGPRTLRAYSPRVAGGESFMRGRAAVARAYSFGSVLMFSDFGWAGDRDTFDFDDALISVGAGVSLLDGLIRLDGAYGLRDPKGFRVDFYLDAIL
ncbi:MAG: hypothetical protein IIC35_01220 [Gemmatimonadetes bacterium]|nr:hypothetical protein [Gemmatimonadota bacterium]